MVIIVHLAPLLQKETVARVWLLQPKLLLVLVEFLIDGNRVASGLFREFCHARWKTFSCGTLEVASTHMRWDCWSKHWNKLGGEGGQMGGLAVEPDGSWHQGRGGRLVGSMGQMGCKQEWGPGMGPDWSGCQMGAGARWCGQTGARLDLGPRARWRYGGVARWEQGPDGMGGWWELGPDGERWGLSGTPTLSCTPSPIWYPIPYLAPIPI